MALVDHYEAQGGHRGEDSRTRPHHHRCLSGRYALVLAHPLPRRQSAVQHPHPVSEPGTHPADHLRSERDLRHQQDGARALLQGAGDQAQVDLGLAAAGHPPQDAFRQARLGVGAQ